MATNLHIDPVLLERAKSLSGLTTKRETVHEALKEFIRQRVKKELLQLAGSVEYFEDYDYKALRRGKNP